MYLLDGPHQLPAACLLPRVAGLIVVADQGARRRAEELLPASCDHSGVHDRTWVRQDVDRVGLDGCLHQQKWVSRIAAGNDPSTPPRYKCP